ncbi:hypothetical protein C9374_006060 [Naegleria lovaniensis]|uniref:Uncharacterized protein n=1 Tax=Naegleria lovaniensis TaxID=51637 RepID=A0AA88GIM9_NAELO|nr:uncharacterized protein C9374_006060 [Naegleria lovaniensis]KAG2381676.1 hypothetical protein C9374_006060 [Naegleria lovaniensis]
MCASYQVLSEKDFKVMPWKNGMGTTTQFCIHPRHCESVSDDFTWRLSSAVMNGGGPFSIFDGYSRVLILLDCQEMKEVDHHSDASEKYASMSANNYQYFLQHHEKDTTTKAELKLMEPYVFSGSLKTDFEIVRNTDSNVALQITDFNIMTKNGRAQCDLVKCVNTHCDNDSLMKIMELDQNSDISILAEERQWNLFIYNVSRSSIQVNGLKKPSKDEWNGGVEEICPSCLLWINIHLNSSLHGV